MIKHSGRERSERTLGWESPTNFTLKGLHTGRISGKTRRFHL